MTMTAQARAEFVDAYTHVLVTSWSSEDFTYQLDTNPAAALGECGLRLPADATVEVVRTIPERALDASLETQVEAWEYGLRTGHYRLHIPDIPPVALSELTEGELDPVAAGTAICAAVPCCCCPCCCCTVSDS
jgi:hypothetical protein